MKKNHAKGEQRYCKAGTSSGQRLWVRPDRNYRATELVVGARCQFRERAEFGYRWQTGIIRMIGPEPEFRLYIDLW